MVQNANDPHTVTAVPARRTRYRYGVHFVKGVGEMERVNLLSQVDGNPEFIILPQSRAKVMLKLYCGQRARPFLLPYCSGVYQDALELWFPPAALYR